MVGRLVNKSSTSEDKEEEDEEEEDGSMNTVTAIHVEMLLRPHWSGLITRLLPTNQ